MVEIDYDCPSCHGRGLVRAIDLVGGLKWDVCTCCASHKARHSRGRRKRRATGEQKVEWHAFLGGAKLHAAFNHAAIEADRPLCSVSAGGLMPVTDWDREHKPRCKTCCKKLGIEPGVGVPE